MEWQSSAVQATNHDHHLRCISSGLESSLQWHQDRGSLEPLGARNAHKLPRITGSNPGSKNLSEGPDREISVITVGKSNICSIYQQHGGYSIPLTDRSGQSPLDVGPVQRHCTDCGVHTRGSKCYSRCRVQVYDGQDRLEASPQVVPRDQPEVGTPGSVPVCISPVHSTTSLLQLEARSPGRGNRCIHPAVGEVQRLCEPPWCLVGRVPSQVQQQQAQVILVAPVWKGQSLYPVLLEMLYDYPQQLPCTLSLFQWASNVNQMDLLPLLAIWPVSGKNLDVEDFWRQLKSSYLHPGGEKHPEPMTHTSRNGWVGVLNRTGSRFRTHFRGSQFLG